MPANSWCFESVSLRIASRDPARRPSSTAPATRSEGACPHSAKQGYNLQPLEFISIFRGLHGFCIGAARVCICMHILAPTAFRRAAVSVGCYQRHPANTHAILASARVLKLHATCAAGQRITKGLAAEKARPHNNALRSCATAPRKYPTSRACRQSFPSPVPCMPTPAHSPFDRIFESTEADLATAKSLSVDRMRGFVVRCRGLPYTATAQVGAGRGSVCSRNAAPRAPQHSIPPHAACQPAPLDHRTGLVTRPLEPPAGLMVSESRCAPQLHLAHPDAS